MLYGSVVTPSDLFQVGDSIIKGMVAGGGLEKSEVKVNFGSCCYASRQTYVEVKDTYSEGGTHEETLCPQSKARVMNKR